MKNFVRAIYYSCLSLLVNACAEEDLTSKARLIFKGNNIENLNIEIYPETIFIVSELIKVKPLIRNLSPSNGNIAVSNLNPGNYTWYDGTSNIGFFQITAGKTRTFEFIDLR